jgi:NitT/TauT family transport system substrate-binding protein
MLGRREFIGAALAVTLPLPVWAQASPPQLWVAHSTWLGYGPLYVGRNKGFFVAEGVDVQPTLIEASSDSLAALAAGRIDAVASSFDGFALFAANGTAMKVVLALDESSGGDGIVSRKEIATIADLKGKKVAVQKGSVAQFILANALNTAGLSFADIEIVDLKAGDAGAAFVAGRVDAAVTWQPWLGRAQETEFGKILIDTRSLPGLVVDGIAVRPDVVAKTPELVDGLVRGWFKTIEFIASNPDEANAIMADSLGMTVDSTVAASKDLRFFGKAENAEFFGGEPSTANTLFDKAGEFYKSVGVLNNTVAAADTVAADFVLRASSV